MSHRRLTICLDLASPRHSSSIAVPASWACHQGRSRGRRPRPSCAVPSSPAPAQSWPPPASSHRRLPHAPPWLTAHRRRTCRPWDGSSPRMRSPRPRPCPNGSRGPAANCAEGSPPPGRQTERLGRSGAARTRLDVARQRLSHLLALLYLAHPKLARRVQQLRLHHAALHRSQSLLDLGADRLGHVSRGPSLALDGGRDIWRTNFSRSRLPALLVVENHLHCLSWRVLEAELEDIAFAGGSLEPRAPPVDLETSKGGVALVPRDDQLLEVARAHLPHLGLVGDPLRPRQLARASWREITHDERVKPLLQGVGWHGPVDADSVGRRHRLGAWHEGCLRRQLLLPGASPSQNDSGTILTTCRACQRQQCLRGAFEACRAVGRPRHQQPLTGRCVRWGGACCVAQVRVYSWGVGLAGPCRQVCVVLSVRELRPRGRWSSAHGIVVQQLEFRRRRGPRPSEGGPGGPSCPAAAFAVVWSIGFRPSGRRCRGLRPGEGWCRGPARGAGRRSGWQRGGWRIRCWLRS
eukprot:scaffold71990_cov65-Phaeocystis_antarctica.AAC.4